MSIQRLAILVSIALVAAACGGTSSNETTTTLVSTTLPPGSTTPDQPSVGELLPNQELPSSLRNVTGAWETDFTRATVDLNELLVGIPASDPRDAIPPIDSPRFDAVRDSDWMSDREPGLLVDIGDDARFYPLSVMTRHEIVNDEVGGTPVAVTYCPLCNTAVTFDRRFDGEVLRLGVSGLLRKSDLVMWDDVSQTLWQQVTGEGIVGEHAGGQLEFVPSAIVRWADFRESHPDGRALAFEQGFGIPYGVNPYEFYSSRDRPFNFFTGDIDDRFPALERVVGVTVDGVSKAYPFSGLEDVRVVNDTVAGQPIVVFWGSPDTADALDARDITNARSVGTGLAFSSEVAGQLLTFEPDGDDTLTDVETGTTWNTLGQGIDGELAGSQLDLLTHRNEFWFAWQAFFPDSAVWETTTGRALFVGLTEESAESALQVTNPGGFSLKPLRR